MRLFGLFSNTVLSLKVKSTKGQLVDDVNEFLRVDGKYEGHKAKASRPQVIARGDMQNVIFWHVKGIEERGKNTFGLEKGL